MCRVEQDTAFDNDLFELKNLIEDGKGEQDLKESAWKKVQKFLYVRHYGSRVSVTFNEKAIAEEKKYHGYFALVSNCEKDPFECLRKYRKRGVIEFFFESGKPKAIIGEVEGVLFVVFTETAGPDWTATRIISARAADEEEVKMYFDWKYGEQ